MPLTPTTLQLVQTNSLPALVHAEIEQLILRGELAVGQRVNESELALRFGTSRGPIREALRALEESGLVRSEKIAASLCVKFPSLKPTRSTISAKRSIS